MPSTGQFNGEALRRLRLAADLTQEELCLKVGGYLSPATVSSLETGRTVDPHVETVKKLADALHVELTVLLDPELYTDHIEAVSESAKKDRRNQRRRSWRRMRRREAEQRQARL